MTNQTHSELINRADQYVELLRGNTHLENPVADLIGDLVLALEGSDHKIDRLTSALGRIHGYVRGATRRVIPEEYAEWERLYSDD